MKKLIQNVLVSVIIPIFNSQAYLRECLNSIVEQTYMQLEIIMVNDGSTDDSLTICREYEKKYNNFIVIDSTNCGVSTARNKGLNKATGKYIQFVDSDDILYPTAIEEKVHMMEGKTAQLMISDYKFIRNKMEKNGCISLISQKEMTLEEYVNYFSFNPTSLFFGVLWNKFYLTRLIRESELQFNSESSFSEDFEFNLEYLRYVEKIIYQPHIHYGYFYEITKDSLSKNKELYHSMWEKRKQLYKKYCLLFEEKKLKNTEKENYIFEGYGGEIEQYLRNQGFKQAINRIHELRNDSQIIELYGYKGKNRKYSMLSYLLKHNHCIMIALLYRIHMTYRKLE